METSRAVAGYELLERIAGVGDATVHRARELSSGRECALAVLQAEDPTTPEQEERQLRFLEEAKQLLAFQHPNVVRIYDVGSARGRVWLAHEWVDGVSLEDLLEGAGGELPLGPTLAVGIQAGQALEAMAAAELVHRDVSSRSVLVDRTGRVRLAGFGLNVESSYERLSAGQAPLGSVDFLSPEQVEGDLPPSPKTDVYGLGAILYRCLSGRTPHSGASLFTRLQAIAHEAPPDLRELNPQVPDPVAELVSSCMEWDADDRPLPADVPRLLAGVAAQLGHQGEGWERELLAQVLAGQAARAAFAPRRPMETPLRLRLRGTDRTIDRTLEVGEGLDIGRSQDADVSLRYGWISRRHARIERRREGLVLVDHGSANGTLLNQERVQGTVPLTGGDLVTFGKSRFEVLLLEGGPEEEPGGMRCQLCGQELTAADLEEGETAVVCVRCQAATETHREAADRRIRLALEEAQFQVVARTGRDGPLKRYRVRRHKKAFLASAVELGQRAARQFADESRPALALQHPALLRTLDLEVRAGVLIGVGEDLDGVTLEDLVARRAPASPRETVALGVPLCEAAAYLLAQGVRHVLVRPDLVLIGRDGHPRLLDAGLAPALVEAPRGGLGPVPCYLAPEVQDLREQTPAACVYALGATLSFAITGAPVAELRGEERYDLLPLTMVSSIPRDLALLLSQATSPEPADRPRDPQALAAALRGLTLGAPPRRQEDLLDSDEMTRPVDLKDLPPGIVFEPE